MDWIKTVIYIAAALIFLGFLPFVCVIQKKEQQFILKIKYLGIAVYTFKYSERGAVNRLFIFKTGKKKAKEDDSQEISFDEKVKRFQEKTLSKLDELSAENEKSLKLREKYANDPKKLKQIEKIDRKREKDLRKKKLRKQLGMLKSGVNNLGVLLKHSKISKLNIDFIIRTPDVAQRAVLYGTVSAVVYNSISLLKQLTKVKIKKIDILFDNNSGNNQWCGSLKYKINSTRLLFIVIKFMAEISKS